MNPKSSNVHAKVRVPQLLFGIILYNLPSISLSFITVSKKQSSGISTMLCQRLRPFWPCMVYNAHEIRSGPETTNKVKLKSYLLDIYSYNVTYHQYELLRQPHTSDYKFDAMSALISADSPEKWIELGFSRKYPHTPHGRP